METDPFDAASTEWDELQKMNDLQRFCSLAAVEICENYSTEYEIYSAGPDMLKPPSFPEVTLSPEQHSFGDFYLYFTFEPFNNYDDTAGSLEITQSSDDPNSKLWHQIEQQAMASSVDTSEMTTAARMVTLFVTDEEIIECEAMLHFLDDRHDEPQIIRTDEAIIAVDVGETSDIAELDRTIDNTQQTSMLEVAMVGLDMLYEITKTRAEAASLLGRNINHLQKAEAGDIALLWEALEELIDERSDYMFNYESDGLTVISLSAIADLDAQVDIRYIRTDEPTANPYSFVKISYVNGASIEYYVDPTKGACILREGNANLKEQPMTALEAIEVFDVLNDVAQALPLPQPNYLQS